MQIKLLSQRADTNALDGRLIEAVSDSREAVEAAKRHAVTIAEASARLHRTFAPILAPAVPTTVEGADETIPVCILPETVVAQLQLQLCLTLVQHCDFKGVEGVVAQLTDASARSTVYDAVNNGVNDIIEAASELVAGREFCEALRSYAVALEGLAAMKVSCLDDWNVFLFEWL